MESNSNIALHSYELIEKAINEIDDEEVLDIYAVSFFIHDESDDPRCPTLTLGYNSHEFYQEEIASADDEQEAKWNYACWLQNELCVIGGLGTPSAAMIQSWIEEQGLMYTDEEWMDDTTRCIEIGRSITKNFVDMAVELSRQLHANGVIEEKFKRPIPIIIHEYEYYDEIAEQCVRANPEGLVDEFVSWIESM